jgi:hypothetical protein
VVYLPSSLSARDQVSHHYKIYGEVYFTPVSLVISIVSAQEIHNVSSNKFCTLLKENEMVGACSHMQEMRNAYKILVRKPEEKETTQKTQVKMGGSGSTMPKRQMICLSVCKSSFSHSHHLISWVNKDYYKLNFNY